MKKTFAILMLLVAALCFAAVSAADDGGHGNGDNGKHKGQHKGDHTRLTFTLTTDDHGCSGALWATDTVKRTWDVKSNGDGTYRVRRTDRGTFATTGGVSPGNCPDNKSHHGHAVRAGVTGHLVGYLTGTVSGGTFNPNATCTTAGGCGTRDAFILTY